MKLLFFIALMFLAAVVHAEQTKTVFSPFTGKLDFITALSTTSISAGSGISVSTTTAGVQISGGASSCGTSPVGIKFIDVNLCSWCETIDISGVLTTALLSCPSSTSILMENGTYILQEDGTKISVE